MINCGCFTFQNIVGNSDGESVKNIYLYKHVTARFLRFHPQAWNGSICMRVEIYGCEGR